MSLFGSPGKCCYWEDGKKSTNDYDHAPCKTFVNKEREKKKYWVDGIDLDQYINSNLSINGKQLCYTLHIFKHVESVGLECNNETQLNEYLKELIVNNNSEFRRLRGLQYGRSVELCLKDSNNNNILLVVKTVDDKYLIFHLSKRNDETCMRGDWETGLDNYEVPQIKNNINPMQYKLFKTEQMEEEDREAIKEWHNSPSLPNDSSPVSIVEPPSSPMSEKKSSPKGSPKTPRSLRKKITSLIKRIKKGISKKSAISQFPQTEIIKKQINEIDDAIEHDELKQTYYEDKLVKLDSEPVSTLSLNAPTISLNAPTFTPSPPKVLNVDAAATAKGPPRGIRSPDKGPPLPPAKVLNVDAAAPIPTPTPTSSLRRSAPVWSPKNPPSSKGGTKKRIKKRKTKKRKTKSKKTKRKH